MNLNNIGRKLTQIFAIKSFSLSVIGVDLRESAAKAVAVSGVMKRGLNPIGRKLTQIFAIKSFSLSVIGVDLRESAAEVCA